MVPDVASFGELAHDLIERFFPDSKISQRVLKFAVRVAAADLAVRSGGAERDQLHNRPPTEMISGSWVVISIPFSRECSTRAASCPSPSP